MNNETSTLLQACRDAGYTHISVGIRHKSVPSSMKIEWYGEQKHGVASSNGQYTGGIPMKTSDGKQIGWTTQPHVVCAHPPRRDSGRPAIWDIVEDSDLTAGMLFRGAGCCETHQISTSHNLELGVYELTEGKWLRTIKDKWTEYK